MNVYMRSLSGSLNNQQYTVTLTWPNNTSDSKTITKTITTTSQLWTWLTTSYNVCSWWSWQYKQTWWDWSVAVRLWSNSWLIVSWTWSMGSILSTPNLTWYSALYVSVIPSSQQSTSTPKNYVVWRWWWYNSYVPNWNDNTKFKAYIASWNGDFGTTLNPVTAPCDISYKIYVGWTLIKKSWSRYITDGGWTALWKQWTISKGSQYTDEFNIYSTMSTINYLDGTSYITSFTSQWTNGDKYFVINPSQVPTIIANKTCSGVNFVWWWWTNLWWNEVTVNRNEKEISS